MAQTKTLEQHFEGVRKRAELRFNSQELNIFAEEIERAKTATIDSVKNRLPKEITEIKRFAEFSPSYEHPEGLKYWREMQAEGFTSQPIPGMDHFPVSDASIVMRTCPNFHRDSIEFLEFRNAIFDNTFRITDPSRSRYVQADYQDLTLPNLDKKIWAFTCEDTKFARIRDNIEKGTHKIFFAYLVGEVVDRPVVRPAWDSEIQSAAQPLLVEQVFGIRPPKDEDILTTLLKVHEIKDPVREWRINWVDAKRLSYPLTQGALYVYKDAKESGLFEKLDFGILERNSKKVDPVLAGTYQSLRVPLCYWK